MTKAIAPASESASRQCIVGSQYAISGWQMLEDPLREGYGKRDVSESKNASKHRGIAACLAHGQENH
jgi:hypothetical protein